MLAIAVFLFGYSLTPHGRPRRRLFAGTASIFVAIAATNALVTSLNPPKAPPKAAAEAYAEGQVAADSSDPHAAVEHFTKAIDLDSGFADAYIGRAEARFLEGAPQALGSGAGVTTPEALEEVIADERKVRSLGIKDPLFYAELGSDLLALGLHRHSKGNLKEAAGLLKRAAAQAHGDASDRLRPGRGPDGARPLRGGRARLRGGRSTARCSSRPRSTARPPRSPART